MKPVVEPPWLEGALLSFRAFSFEVPALLPYWHYHQALELTYIDRGEGMRFVGDSIEPFQHGDLVLLGENLPHQWVTDLRPGDEPVRVVVIQFPHHLLTALPECQVLLPLAESAKQGLHYATPEPGFVERMLALPTLPPLAGLLSLFELLSQLATRGAGRPLSSVSFAAHPSLHQSRATAVLNYLVDHHQRPLTLPAVAQVAGMSPPAFCRWFKQLMGKSFVSYLQHMRIEKACQYLLQTDWTVAQIAFEVGFESPHHFHRIFKKIKDTTPLAYRSRRVMP